jgi:hypothetical protein
MRLGASFYIYRAPQATAHPDSDCADCHRDHAGRDRVWVQFYPVLRKLLP